MKFQVVGAMLILLLVGPGVVFGQRPAITLPSSTSLDSVRVKGFLSPSRAPVNTPVTMDILLQNIGPSAVSPITADVPQFLLQDAERGSLKNLVLPPRSRLLRRVTIVPRQVGPFDVEVQLTTPGDASLEPVAHLEVIELPGLWSTYAATVIQLVLGVATVLVTFLIQHRVLRATLEQRASESVIQIVTTQGRDYYFPLSVALRNLVRTLEALHARPGGERGHLLRRAFFFYGIFTYKENEFGFNHGFLYLGHLWGELAVRRIIDQISALVPLAPPHEAIIHKCFSDVWRVHRGAGGPDSVQLFPLRTLYDLERLLTKTFWRCSRPEQTLRNAFDAVTPYFQDPTLLEQLRPLARILAATLEYEFTKLFKDWYAGAKGERQPPEAAPPDFDEIIGGTPTWHEVRAVVSREARS